MALRKAVSREKRRYQENGFDLDLSYILPSRVIAMGFPSEGFEGRYRNPMKEVQRFLEESHHDHYKVYNLCSERSYDLAKFHGRVEVFPFDDHNAPPFELITGFCQNVAEWLTADTRNCAVVHCKAGKGRTGLMICAYMLFSGEWTSSTDAMRYYAAMRTHNQKGVTIPSQIRYIHYYGKLMRQPAVMAPTTLVLSHIVMHGVPKQGNDIKFSIYVLRTCIFSYKHSKPPKKQKWLRAEHAAEDAQEDEIGAVPPALLDAEPSETGGGGANGGGGVGGGGGGASSDSDDEVTPAEEEVLELDCKGTPLHGDIKFVFSDKKDEKMFTFWINTNFIKKDRLVIHKQGLDKAYKDKHNKLFPAYFRLELVFNTTYGGDAAAAAAPGGATAVSSSSPVDSPAPVRHNNAAPTAAAAAAAPRGEVQPAPAVAVALLPPSAAAALGVPTSQTIKDLRVHLQRVAEPPPHAADLVSKRMVAQFGADVLQRHWVRPRSGAEPASGVLNGDVAWDHAPRPSFVVAQELLTEMIALLIESANGPHIDDSALERALMKDRYGYLVLATAELSSVSLTEASHAEQTAFWLNTFHLLLLHANIAYPSKKNRDLDYYNRIYRAARYNIAGLEWSICDIEHSVLRVLNSDLVKFPLTIKKMNSKDARIGFGLKRPEPKLAFALSLSIRSSPQINVYTPDNLARELEAATRIFLNSSIEFSVTKKSLVLPPELIWFQRDFGKKTETLLQAIGDYLTPDKKQGILTLLASLTIKYKEPEWDFGLTFDHLSSLLPADWKARTPVLGALPSGFLISSVASSTTSSEDSPAVPTAAAVFAAGSTPAATTTTNATTPASPAWVRTGGSGATVATVGGQRSAAGLGFGSRGGAAAAAAAVAPAATSSPSARPTNTAAATTTASTMSAATAAAVAAAVAASGGSATPAGDDSDYDFSDDDDDEF